MLQAERRWEPEELARVFPQTFGRTTPLPEATQPPGAERPVRGTAAMQLDPASWQPLTPGFDLWERRAYFEAKEE